MIKHVFRLMWNRKKRNFLLITEIFFSFVVLFAVATMVISSTAKYLRPSGFSYKNVWVLHTDWSGRADEFDDAEIRAALAQIQQETESFPEVKDFGWTSFNYPYGTAQMRMTLDIEGQTRRFDVFETDDSFADVMGLEILEGRWFSREDDATSMTPIIITRKMREEVFGTESPIGYVHSSERRDYVVIGVTGDYRYRGEFEEHRGGFFRRTVLSDSTREAPSIAVFSVRGDAGVQFEERLVRHLSAVAGDMDVRIETIASTRADYIKDIVMEIAVLATVAGFLVLNVALGLFGVLWYSVSRRRGEVGLRRAVGANAKHISRQILCEAAVLATFAVIVGVFFGAQAPILGLDASIGGAVYVFAMACAAGIIYLIVSVCALYPSWLASRIRPAVALHDD